MADETILILANGDWSGIERLGALAAEADWIVAADGGCTKGLEVGLQIDEVIGDLDSIPAPDRARLAEANTPVVHAFPRDKDATDLELAIEHALHRRPRRIVLFGALGERIDHTIANLHLLEKGAETGIPIELIVGRETLFAVRGELKLERAKVGDRVSLIPLSEAARVSTTGLRYPLCDELLYRAGSRGVSNVVSADRPALHVSEGLLWVVHASGSEDENG